MVSTKYNYYFKLHISKLVDLDDITTKIDGFRFIDKVNIFPFLVSELPKGFIKPVFDGKVLENSSSSLEFNVVHLICHQSNAPIPSHYHFTFIKNLPEEQEVKRLVSYQRKDNIVNNLIPLLSHYLIFQAFGIYNGEIGQDHEKIYSPDNFFKDDFVVKKLLEFLSNADTTYESIRNVEIRTSALDVKTATKDDVDFSALKRCVFQFLTKFCIQNKLVTRAFDDIEGSPTAQIQIRDLTNTDGPEEDYIAKFCNINNYFIFMAVITAMNRGMGFECTLFYDNSDSYQLICEVHYFTLKMDALLFILATDTYTYMSTRSCKRRYDEDGSWSVTKYRNRDMEEVSSPFNYSTYCQCRNCTVALHNPDYRIIKLGCGHSFSPDCEENNFTQASDKERARCVKCGTDQTSRRNRFVRIRID